MQNRQKKFSFRQKIFAWETRTMNIFALSLKSFLTLKPESWRGFYYEYFVELRELTRLNHWIVINIINSIWNKGEREKGILNYNHFIRKVSQKTFFLNSMKIIIILCPDICKQETICLFKNSYWRCSLRKAALKNLTLFTEKHLCWSLFLIKLQAAIISKKSLLPSFQPQITPNRDNLNFSWKTNIAARKGLQQAKKKNPTLFTRSRISIWKIDRVFPFLW